MDHTVNLYFCTALPIIRTVLKNQACNIYKHWSYNRKLRVSTVLIYILWREEKNRHRKSIGGHQVAWWCDHFYQGSLEFPRFDFKKLWTNFSFVNTLLYKMMSNFLLLLCKYRQGLIFLLAVIGFEHKGRSCKMRQFVRLKWGHSAKHKLVVNLKE